MKNIVNSLLLGLTARAACGAAEMPANWSKSDQQAMETIWQTPITENTTARLAAMDHLQSYANMFTPEEFLAYLQSDDKKAAAMAEKDPIIYVLESSFEKVLREVTNLQVPEGGIYIWNVYNMGYIVKTPKHCFAIDLQHRRAADMIPYLDFALVTHNHNDHFLPDFGEAMKKTNKPLYSNFYENGFRQENPTEFTFGEITVKTRRTAHNHRNDQMRRFVTAYEINCGKSAGNCVIMHVGDSFDAAELAATQKIDIFIMHLRVGLDVPLAIKEYVKCDYALISHFLEFTHPVDRWRWSFRDGIFEAVKCAPLCKKTALPFWGCRWHWQKSMR